MQAGAAADGGGGDEASFAGWFVESGCNRGAKFDEPLPSNGAREEGRGGDGCEIRCLVAFRPNYETLNS